MLGGLEDVKRLGTFSVESYHTIVTRQDKSRRLAPHRLVVEPLVASAKNIRVYGLRADSPVALLIQHIARHKRGYLELDLAQDVVRGYETLWNGDRWEPRAIVIVSDLTKFRVANVFRFCSGPYIFSSIYQLEKRTWRRVISACKSIAESTSLAVFHFSAFEGIRYMDVFSAWPQLREMYREAEANCRPFKTYAEHDPAADQIIVDRPPYLENEN